ncbi:hypothetical protein FH609_011710 [Streptomyces sp. 3MP-14]|uniref:Phage tail protein n=1 Tax=Streptomyces mimosae TaxID=2586635 RepID=A0A5N6AEH8_9ACTN|nr:MULTISPECIES: hypothetical protein [Streptomyces]KAB8167061.1 hypothetical protein FH607_009160 [Streptomyces mimosae]KAB8177002.1 hypothetical protein FH609_011710 [Streptomyces sp. 3MP-14]
MALLTKDQITAAADLAHEDVPVPEWGGTVRVRALTGQERDAWEASMLRLGPNGSVQARSTKGVRVGLVARCVVDEAGERLFTDKDMATLNEKSAAVIERLAAVARRLSGIGKEAAEEAAGKSATTPGDGSSSD